MTHSSFVTPQTEDGVVRDVVAWEGGRCRVRLRVPLKPRFVDLVRGRESELVFASRSRLARLGIDATPIGSIELDGDVAELEMAIETAIPSYGIADVLPEIVVPGLRLGRLVFCPEENRLSSEELLAEVHAGAVQLPARFSIDDRGVFTIQPHRRVYDLSRDLTRDDVISIVATREGRTALNRMQLARDVENIVLEPGNGVITSCSMFLHRHYVVLDRESHRLGRHLQATVLDPIRTRGTRVFLEFTNCSDKTIVNPSVSARVYRALEVESQPRVFPVALPEGIDDARPAASFDAVRALFDRLEDGVGDSYFDRLVAVVCDRVYASRWRSPTPTCCTARRPT